MDKLGQRDAQNHAEATRQSSLKEVSSMSAALGNLGNNNIYSSDSKEGGG